MTDLETKDDRLKAFLRKQLRDSLLKTGRRLVVEKGVEFLTARKLSEASGVSVGSIYNQFGTMESFILAENMQTLDDLFGVMSAVFQSKDAYVNLNQYVDVFSGFVIDNPQLWRLLFECHLLAKKRCFPFSFVRKTKRIEQLFECQIDSLFGSLPRAQRRLSSQVLSMTLFALSGFLTSEGWENLRQVNRQNVCKLLLNTYLAGLTVLKAR